MPPRRGIVKSGNAGNSSKPIAKPAPDATTSANPAPPPLFPPGSKYPLSLLSERCQRLGWDKPIVDTRLSPGKGGWSFVVKLSRQSKATSSEKDTVVLETHPPYLRPTAIEARHWGATYALYRFCNGMQLHLVLPPGPREYWNELAREHKAIPEHQKWMYEADPFLARKAVEGRQALAAQKREEDSSNLNRKQSQGNSSGHFSSSPEVRMASSLRETVEKAIKGANMLYSKDSDDHGLLLSSESIPDISYQLGKLGFDAAHVRDVTSFLSQPSDFASILLSSSLPLQACIEYLLLHVPECELPQRYLPSDNSSNPFIVSAHSGTDNLKKRWIEEKVIKEAGFPAHTVHELTQDIKILKNWDSLVVALGRRLIGRMDQSQAENPISELYIIDVEESEALGAYIEEEGHLVLPLLSAPIQVHIMFCANQYPRHHHIPIYLTSTSVPAYIRLHLLSQALLALESRPELEEGEGFCMTILQLIEAEWASIEDSGRPDMSMVLKHLISNPQKDIPDPDGLPHIEQSVRNTRSRTNRVPLPQGDPPKPDLEALRNSNEYKATLAAREKLPAYRAKEEFLSLLDQNRVVVVVGETGCGKTTQLPQLILDHMIASNAGSTASIIVTQPRRISAISVAARVSQERLEDGSVGYVIRGESKRTRNTKILFCTTGVVLRRLSSGDTLEGVSYVIVDEVHERSVDGDFLLLELKELLKKHPTLKVVLMSATINHEIFVKYFNNAPLLSIPGFTYPVQDKYLEDVVQMTNYRTSSARKVQKESKGKLKDLEEKYRNTGLDENSMKTVLEIVRSDRIDYQLISSLVNHVMSTATTRGGILIFLSGVAEIRQCLDAIKKSIQQKDAVVLPLHANLSNDEQRKVFQPAKGWKIIAATNVAETSITIDDVIYVIDAGKVKETQHDPESSLTRLVETQVTRAAAKQRRGRAGRTQPGTCYKLYTRNQERDMHPFPIPEILRVPLESILLSVKSAREDEDVKSFLGQAIDPPAIVAIDKAWSILEDLGTIDETGKLTALGKHISVLPMDVRLAKMLVLGTVFQCLGPILTVVSLLSSKPLFVSPLEKREEAARARQRFLSGNSDLLTDVNAFDECLRMHAEGKSHSAVRSFCEQNFISTTTVREVMTLRQDFTSTLAEMELIDPRSTASSPALNKGSGNVNLIKAIMLGGLWPRVARVHLPDSAIKFDKVAAGTVRRENTAKEFKILDLQEGRVFLHPGSVLFGASVWKSPFLFYFHKYMSSKVFLRDASEVPMYAILLFGGTVSVDQVRGGITVGNKSAYIKLRAWPRIGTLVNQLRRLLDLQLQKCIDDGTKLTDQPDNPVIEAMMALLQHDGLSE